MDYIEVTNRNNIVNDYFVDKMVFVEVIIGDIDLDFIKEIVI